VFGKCSNSLNSECSETCVFFCKRKFTLKALHRVITQFLVGKWNIFKVKFSLYILFLLSVILIIFVVVFNIITFLQEAFHAQIKKLIGKG
jgi:hypothetical protein